MKTESKNEEHVNPGLVEGMVDFMRDKLVLACQTKLVNRLLALNSLDGWSEDYIFNYQPSMSIAVDGQAPAPNQIGEWWLVHERLATSLMIFSKPVLLNNDGTWWGRIGEQSIADDGVFHQIARYVIFDELD